MPPIPASPGILNKLLLITGIICATQCGQKRTGQSQRAESTQNANFFPVAQYLLGQLKEIDSLPITPLKITSEKGKADSAWIDRKALRAFALPFIDPPIDSAAFHKYFTERSFLDQTINAFTFAYEPVAQLPDSMEVKRWVIYVDPENGKVNRVYIVKELNSVSPQTVHLTWKSGSYCQITTVTEKEGGAEIKEEKVIWNFDE